MVIFRSDPLVATKTCWSSSVNARPQPPSCRDGSWLCWGAFSPIRSSEGEHAYTLPGARGAPRYLASLAWGRASESAWLAWW